MEANSFVFEKMQKTCLKHCTNTILKAQLDGVEELCLRRCVNKYTEAVEFTVQQFKIHQLKFEDQEKIQQAQAQLFEQQQVAKQKLLEKLHIK